MNPLLTLACECVTVTSMTTTHKRYSYRAYPTPGQERSLAHLFGCVRVVYNDFIAERQKSYAEGSPFESMSVVRSRVVTQAKRTTERSWLADVAAVPLNEATRDADLAYRNFFDSLSGKRKGRKVGAPRYRSKRDRRQTARFGRTGFKVRETTHGVGKVRLARIGWIRFELARALPSEPSSVTVIREADGTYHVSFVVVTPESDRDLSKHSAGVDLGLTDFASVVGTDGVRYKVENPRHLRRTERSLARAQKALSRKVLGSANREKARLRVARLHSRVRRTRLDFHHKIAARLARENQAVAVEALNVVGISRAGNRGLRKSVHDAGWGQFLRVLAEKVSTVPVNPAYTSQTCSVCDTLDGPKPLAVREWSCSGCGTHLDRDYNAAVNILVAAGLAETVNACGVDVRRALARAVGSEAGTHRSGVVL